MPCLNCGAETRPGDQACANCGAMLNAAPAAPGYTPAPPVEKKSNTTKIIIVVVIALLVLCCCCVLAFVGFTVLSDPAFMNTLQGG